MSTGLLAEGVEGSEVMASDTAELGPDTMVSEDMVRMPGGIRISSEVFLHGFVITGTASREGDALLVGGTGVRRDGTPLLCRMENGLAWPPSAKLTLDDFEERRELREPWGAAAWWSI